MSITVSQYLMQRLHELGITTLFTLPGEHLGPFLKDVSANKNMKLITNTTDQECAFAADCYAKCFHRPGSLAVNFGNGSLQVLNAMTGSYVEHTPVVLISAAPSMKSYYQARDGGVLRNSTSGNFSELEMFRKVTIQAERIEAAYLAPLQIDQTLTACLNQLKPVYLEIPEDVWHLKCPAPSRKIERTAGYSDPQQLEYGVKEILRLWNASKTPLVWAGLGISRHSVVDSFKTFLDKSNSFYSTNVTAKGILNERNDKFVGVYTGKSSSKETLEAFRRTDLILAFGINLTDIDILSMTLDDLSDKTIIFVGQNTIRVDKFQAFTVTIKDVLDLLVKRMNSKEMKISSTNEFHQYKEVEHPIQSELTYDSIVHHIRQSNIITKNSVLIGDVSLSMFPLSTLRVDQNQFISGIGWSTKGYSFGAAVGVVSTLQQKRPIIFCGDGCFQENGQSLNTLIKMKSNAIVFVFNNGSLNIEQWVMNPTVFKNENTPLDPYNIIPKWTYSKFVESIGGHGFEVEDHHELSDVLKKIEKMEGVCLVDMKIPQKNVPESVKWKFQPENK
eukprot:gene12490-6238_t